MNTYKRLLLIVIIMFLIPNALLADTSIGNGKLYTCRGNSIISNKTGAEVPAKKAKAKYTRIIKKQDKKIAESSKGSKKRKKAQKAKKAAKQGRRDVKLCKNGKLDNQLIGSWNIVLENGLTPAQNGYNSLTLTFTADEFTSDLDGPVDCHWEGTYSFNDDSTAINVLTNVGTGGTPCSNAVGQERPALVELSEDGNTLTLDYRPNGTLQVYERVS